MIPTKNMKKVLNIQFMAGDNDNHAPRLIAEILQQFFNSEQPLAEACRQRAEDLLAQMHKNTELCIDLKTWLADDPVATVGKTYQGCIVRDDDCHFTFVECCPPQAHTCTVKRNEMVYQGRYINVTRREDGSLRPNFKALHMEAGFCPETYAAGVACELTEALNFLIVK